MSAVTTDRLPTRCDTPRIRTIGASEPLQWLAAGWSTLKAIPGPSLLYGALAALTCGAALALTLRLPGFTVAFLTGLLLIGALLSAGLCSAPRQLEAGAAVSVRAGVRLLAYRGTDMGLYTVLLAIIVVAWVRAASLLFALKFNTLTPSIEGYLGMMAGGADPMVIAYFALIAVVLALALFITGAFAVPLILDRDMDPVTAMHTSARAFARNWRPLLLWAALIAALTLAAMLTLFAAMAVLFPLLGYATWHGYRRLIA